MAFREGDPEDVLTLDVGGNILRVKRGVLTQVKGSLLAVKFSGRWDTIDNAIDGEQINNGHKKHSECETIFLDISPELFRPLVESLRMRFYHPTFSDSVVDSEYFGGSKCKIRRYLALVDHYGLLETLYPTQIMASSGNGSHEMPEFFDPSGVTVGQANKPTNFRLCPAIIDLLITSIQIDAVTPDFNECAMKIGWNYRGKDHHSLPNFGGFTTRHFDLKGKRWIMEYSPNQRGNGMVRLTITKPNDNVVVREAYCQHVPTDIEFVFEGYGVFHISNVKLSY